MAWCIVPFDAKKRGPEERAVMLVRLGIRKLAYDYRAEHIPSFDAEVDAMRRHGIEFAAWWFPTDLNDEAQQILAVIERQKIHPQLWVTGGGEFLQPGAKHQAKVAAEAARILPIATAAGRLGCKVALYNHGGWFGEPENQIEVIESLQKQGIQNVGIVYNFHHGHSHLPRFGEVVRKMKPYLLAVNLNGMVVDGEKSGKKILPLSSGTMEREMMRVLAASGWSGPVGIIDHREETDSELTLLENLKGLRWLRAELEAAGSGGERPFPPTQNGETPAMPAFFPDARPLRPQEHPHCDDKVNRDRFYDFYTKQALHFAKAQPMPAVVPAFMGLDGGRYGHWGNQNEEVWRNTDWSEMELGGMQCGIMKIADKLVPRSVCVHMPGAVPLSACFDTDRLQWVATWTGDAFVKFDALRWGMLGQVTPAAEVSVLTASSSPQSKSKSEYRGFYRHGDKVIFSYALDGEEWLEAGAVVDGKWNPVREKRGGKLEEWTRGGPAQWPQRLESTVQRGSGAPYAVDTFPLPVTPWKSLWHICGLDFLPNGDAALSTFEGEVWLVSGLDAPDGKLKWKRFAAGLSQPLGLKVVEGKICLMCRDQLTRLHDFNGDDEADFYESWSRAFETAVGGHDYQTGLEMDAEGRFYFAGGKQGITRIAADRKSSEVLATGLRNPNGLAVSKNGIVVAAAQEGEWTAASLLTEIQPGGHYRHGGPKPGPLGNLPPTLYLPRGVENSCGGQVFVDSTRWGLPEQSLLHFSWGYGRVFCVLREEVNGQKQGCAMILPGEFASGTHRGRFRAQDGQLYVCGTTGWGTYTPESGCFQRLRYTGPAVVAPTAFHAHSNGIRFEFPAPLAAEEVEQALRFAQQWNYRIGPAYGSEEYSVRWPSLVGHDVLAVKSLQLVDGGRTLFVELPQLQPCHQLHLHLGVRSFVCQDFYLTLHALAEDFTEFAGYAKVEKQMPSATLDNAAALAVDASPWEKGAAGRELRLNTAAGLQFEQKELRAKAGERISLTLNNSDPIPHNWTLCAANAGDRVAELADKMISDPAGYRKSYVPETPEVLVYTKLVEANKTTTVHFTAPKMPGSYPYICTFPGHTKVMRGVLIVE